MTVEDTVDVINSRLDIADNKRSALDKLTSNFTLRVKPHPKCTYVHQRPVLICL